MKQRHIFIDISGGYMVGSVLRHLPELRPSGTVLFKCNNEMLVDNERLTLHTKLAERVLCSHLTDMTRYY
jgi:hypothetical protein